MEILKMNNSAYPEKNFRDSHKNSIKFLRNMDLILSNVSKKYLTKRKNFYNTFYLQKLEYLTVLSHEY